MKYPQTQIFLDNEIPESDSVSLDKSEVCPINGKRWVHGADIYGFGKYLQLKVVFRGPFTLVKSTVTCPNCRATTPIVAIEAAGYVPCSGESHDLALNIAFFLEGGVDELLPRPVYLTYLQECPSPLLKQIRKHSFLYRKHDFGDHMFFANACEHCKQPIDDFLIYYEMDGPLARCNPSPAREVYSLPYSMPIVVDAQFA